METNPEKNQYPEKGFELLARNGTVDGKFINRQPRQAALKAANQGNTVIILREVVWKDPKGKNVAKLHIFNGSFTVEPCDLPLPPAFKKGVEKKAGKSLPPELNAKGKEEEFKKAGFVLPTCKVPKVNKVGTFRVPKGEGGDLHETIGTFLKGRPDITQTVQTAQSAPAGAGSPAAGSVPGNVPAAKAGA